MTTKKTQFCTDEELLEELKKLGYNDVSPDVLEIMKDDLSQLITKEQYPLKASITKKEKEPAVDGDTIKYRYSQKQFHASKNSSESENPLSPNVAFDREMNFSEVSASNREVSKSTSFEKYKNTLKSYKTGIYRRHENLSVDNDEKLSTGGLHDPCSQTDYTEKLHEVSNEQCQSQRLGLKNVREFHPDLKQSYPQRQIPRLQRNFSDSDKSPIPEEILDNKFSGELSSSDDVPKVSAFDRYKNTFQNYKRNNYAKKTEIAVPESINKQETFPESNANISSETGYRSSLSSVSLDPNKIKRKVLRHRDGKSVITEEFLDIPSIFNSSYPETQTLDSSKSFSSDDLSWKSNSSTGSISAVSPDTLITPRSTFSLSSTRTFNSRLVNPRKKKNDPVAMYNYYKKFWNEFKPPGEKTHDKIRWAVRDKMLDYN